MNHVSESVFSYPDVRRHWSASSEKYAGGDALLTKLSQGWATAGTVYTEMHRLSSARSVTVFIFELQRGQERLIMPVIANPCVDQLIRHRALMVKPVAAIAQRPPQPIAIPTPRRRQPLPIPRIAAKAGTYPAAARF